MSSTPQLSVLAGEQLHHSTIPSDAIGIIATFSTQDTSTQRQLMLVNNTWFQGVVFQDDGAPKPMIRWPLIALAERKPKSLWLAHDGTDEDLRQLNTHLPFTTAVTLWDVSRITDEGMFYVAKLEHLKSLYVRVCPKLTHDGITTVLKGTKNYASHHLTDLFADVWDGGGDVASLVKALMSLDNLKTLIYTESLNDTSLPQLSTQLTELTEIYLNRYLSDTAIRHLTNFQHLNTLHLGCCTVNVATFRHLTASHLSKTLRHLTMDGAPGVDDRLAVEISKFTSLTHLVLGNSYNLTDIGLTCLSESLHELSVLSLDCGSFITDISLESIAKELHKLTALVLRKCVKLTDAGGLFHIAHNPELQEHLKVLDISGCRSIGDICATQHITRLKNLTTLRIDDTNISSVGMVGGVLKQLTYLTELVLYGSQVAEECMRDMPKLRHLDTLVIDQNYDLTNEGLAYLQEVPSLTSLTMSGCFEVDDDAFPTLEALVTEKEQNPLRKLVVDFCEKIFENEDALTALSSKLASQLVLKDKSPL